MNANIAYVSIYLGPLTRVCGRTAMFTEREFQTKHKKLFLNFGVPF